MEVTNSALPKRAISLPRWITTGLSYLAGGAGVEMQRQRIMPKPCYVAQQPTVAGNYQDGLIERIELAAYGHGGPLSAGRVLLLRLPPAGASATLPLSVNLFRVAVLMHPGMVVGAAEIVKPLSYSTGTLILRSLSRRTDDPHAAALSYVRYVMLACVSH